MDTVISVLVVVYFIGWIAMVIYLHVVCKRSQEISDKHLSELHTLLEKLKEENNE